MSAPNTHDAALRSRFAGRSAYTTSTARRRTGARSAARDLLGGKLPNRCASQANGRSRDVLSGRVRRRKPAARALRLARRIDASCAVVQVRRHPGIAAWCLLWVLLLPQLRVWRGLPAPNQPSPTEQAAWLRDRTEDAVHKVLRVIEHGVTIREIGVRRLEPRVLACYWNGYHQIDISSEICFSKDELLSTVSHECVHAIFDQAHLERGCPRAKWPARQLIEETTAYVLGAHIAGIVRTREGGNGRALTEKLLSEYRSSCDPMDPESMHQKVAAKHGTDDEYPPDLEMSISIHFGSPELVDRIDAICRANPDPWEAARAVAEIYFMSEEAATPYSW